MVMPYAGGRSIRLRAGGALWRVLHNRLLAGLWLTLAAVTAMSASAAESAAGSAEAERAILDAAAAYATAVSDGDLNAIAAQWADQAELVEADMRLVGRDQITAAIAAGLARSAGMQMTIEIEEIAFVSPSLARVNGGLRVQGSADDTGSLSRFTSLRVREGDAWLLAESVVTPIYDNPLAAIEWLTGEWTGTTPGGLPVSLHSHVDLEGAVLFSQLDVGAAGDSEAPVFQATNTVHADPQTGELRCWSFDSTGARAEGLVVTDGNRLNRILTGVTVTGESRWVQVITPLDENRIAIQSIERSLNGDPLPDTDVLILTRTTP